MVAAKAKSRSSVASSAASAVKPRPVERRHGVLARPFARVIGRQVRLRQILLDAMLAFADGGEEQEIRRELMAFGQRAKAQRACSKQCERIGQAHKRRRRDFSDRDRIVPSGAGLTHLYYLTNHTGHVTDR